MFLMLQAWIARLIALVVTLLTALAAGNLLPVVPPVDPSSAAPTSAAPSATQAVDPTASPTAVPTDPVTVVPPVEPTASPTAAATVAPTPTAPPAELASARTLLLPDGSASAEYLVVKATDSAGVELAWPGYRYQDTSIGRVIFSVRPATGQVWFGTAAGDVTELPATVNDLDIAFGTPCNSLTGFARVDGSSLLAGGFMQMAIGCEAKWTEAATWLAGSGGGNRPGFLAPGSIVEVSRTADGNVQLVGDRGTLVLAPLS